MTARTWFPNGITGRHVLIALVAFFGVMLVANGIFVYLALSTFGGLDASNAYRQGLKYNERVAESQAQAARGWQVEVVLADEADRLTVEFLDQFGAPVRGLGVAAVLARPATDASDRTLELREADAGRYTTSLDRLPAGNWVLSLLATRLTSKGEQPRYRLKQRLWVSPRS